MPADEMMTRLYEDGDARGYGRVLAGLVGCCLGAAEYGPMGCTCWVAEYDLEQAPPDTTTRSTTRDAMCDRCAFRPGSPERSGDERYVGSGDGGTELFTFESFHCHEGARRVLRWRHPLGITVESDGDFYKPPKLTNDAGEPTPYAADGQPLQLCAGFAAHHRARP